MPPKRKHVVVSDSDDLSDELEDAADVSDPFIRPKISRKLPQSDSDWIVKYAPVRSAEVCVNPRKLKEVKEILQQMVAGQLSCRLLVVTGPSGCAKSTLIRCLGNELIEAHKQTMAGGELGNITTSENVVEYLDSQVDDVRRDLHFSDFLDECRYRVGHNLALILVEELPNIFHRETLEKFRLSLKNWIHSDAHMPPLVVCLTEVEIESESGNFGYYTIENNLTAETVLGRELAYHSVQDGLVKRCLFLPIAKTFMKKALLAILTKENIKTTDIRAQLEVLTALYETGDIRSLIGTLQFWLRHRDDGLDVGSMMREQHLLLFHAVGKVIHSSTKYAHLENSLADYHSVENVAEYYTNFGLLQLGLLENYHIYNGLNYDIAVAAELVDALSLCDTLNTMEAPHYGIRAVRNILRSVDATPGRTLQMKFPRQFKMVRAANQVRREVHDYARYLCNLQVSFSDVNLVDGCLVPAIYNSFRHKLSHGSKPYAYNRVGGRFQAIVADDDIPVMDSNEEHARGVRDQFRIEIEAKMDYESDDDDNEPLSEDIDDSDVEKSASDDLDDSLDDELLLIKNDEDDFSDDPELNMLVSQGRI